MEISESTEITENDIIIMGHGAGVADIEVLTALVSDSRPRFRALALSGLVRRDPENSLDAWHSLIADPDWHVRRRVAELAIDLGRKSASALVKLMSDDMGLVRETACFAVGEIFEADGEKFSADGSTQETGSRSEASAFSALNPSAGIYNDVIEKLIFNAKDEDPLVRESAIASLGNIGDERAREVVIAACTDKAPIRRRAVVALAAFSGDDVDAALDVALNDHDWQVRQAAEDISGKKSPKE